MYDTKIYQKRKKKLDEYRKILQNEKKHFAIIIRYYFFQKLIT